MNSLAGALTLISLFSNPLPAHPRAAPPAHIILIRHAEKLVAFITSDPAMTALGTPVAVFATQTTKHDDGQRTQETVAPLAKSLKLQEQTPYLGKDYAALAKAILANPAYAGKTVLICWNHEEIPQLAAALGVNPEPPKWKGSVFDLVYIISYSNGKATLTTSRYGK